MDKDPKYCPFCGKWGLYDIEIIPPVVGAKTNRIRYAQVRFKCHECNNAASVYFDRADINDCYGSESL